ncbi:immunoglobulin superfamily member 6 isoform X1 [Aythya fuligula]|uniref:immunoglobulin superfamily member 6 isoform X1 n=1 Tax=Aythya fuligula TaxID=219594 RepID=UPI0013759A65|nr:immunoglobulin superfamily member 6 isoform X1 [Aythya fuligula]
MASFNSFQKILMLAFNWILYSAGAADKCQVTVRQPRYQKAEYSTQTVSLPCDFSAPECSPSKLQVLWFRFFTNKHEDLCTPTCTNNQKFKVQISDNSTSLQINDLTVNDSAVYFCGIAFSDSSSPHSKQTGGGTILTKRERHSTEEFNCMIVISTLLLLYCTAVFTILIVYKLKPKLLSKSGNEDQRTENCKITSGRKIFQAIAQELQKQRIIWTMTLCTRTDEYVLHFQFVGHF